MLGDNLYTVTSKIGYAVEYACLFSPEAVHEDLTRTAGKAVQNLPLFQPYAVDMPIRGKLSFPSKELADAYNPKSDETRKTDDVTYERTIDRARDVLMF